MAITIAGRGCEMTRQNNAIGQHEELHHQVQEQLSQEPAGSDAAYILAEALVEAEGLSLPERGDVYAAALKRAQKAREFSIVDESPLPEGWPALSLPGLIRVKTYPPARTAWVEDPSARNRQFMVLFRHIKRQEIAMTAPVVMDYGDVVASDGDQPTLGDTEAMAFLYRHTHQGQTGRFGQVDVRDETPLQVVSMGVKGSYSSRRFSKALGDLQAWLGKHPQWRPAGRPRVLAYNSPFVLPWRKYAEVQIPIEPAVDR